MITFDRANLSLQGVQGIEVSDITADPISGGFVRRVQFYVDPLNTVNRRPVLELMLYGEEEALKVKTPSLEF